MGYIRFVGPARNLLAGHSEVIMKRIGDLLEGIIGRPEAEAAQELEELEFLCETFLACNGTRAGWAAKQIMIFVRRPGLKPGTVAVLRQKVRKAERLDERQRDYEVRHGDLTRVRRRRKAVYTPHPLRAS